MNLLGQAGVLDPTFGDNGLALLPQGVGVSRTIEQVSSWRQSSGKIVLAGIGGSDFSRSVLQVRLLPNGQPDSLFANGRLEFRAYSVLRAFPLSGDRYGLLYSVYDNVGNESDRISWFLPDGSPDVLPDLTLPIRVFGPNAIQVLADGKIVAAGADFETGAYRLYRLLPGGLPDPSFGSNGYVSLSAADGDVFQIQLSGADKLTLSGEKYGSDTLVMMRLLSNGTFDPGFGSNGKRTIAGGWGIGQSFGALSVMADERVLFVKRDDPIPEHRIMAVRLLNNGALDPSFGTNGVAVVPIPSGEPYANYYTKAVKVGVTSAGAIKVITNVGPATSDSADVLCAALHADGSPDLTFGNAGFVHFNYDQFDYLEDAIWDATGGFLLVSSKNKLVSGAPEYTRLNVTAVQPSGAVVGSFGANGVAPVVIPYPEEVYPMAYSQNSDGKIVFAGVSDNGLGYAIHIQRLLENGSVDPIFGNNGATDFPISLPGYYRKSGYVWPDGSMVLLFLNSATNSSKIFKFNASGLPESSFGTNGTVTHPGRFSQLEGLADGGFLAFNQFGAIAQVLKFLPNGNTDYSFGNGGLVQLPVASGFSFGGLKVYADGKILVAGNQGNNQNRATVLIRLNANGSPDQTFGIVGKVIDNISDYENISAITLQNDGKILITGDIDAAPAISKDSLYVVRLEQNGSRDTTFGHYGVIVGSQFDRNIPTGILQQPDGKIVLSALSANENGFLIGTYLYTYQPNGIIDSTFGTDGAAFFQAASLPETGQIIWTNGKKLLVSGVLYPSFTLQPVFARFNPDYVSGVQTLAQAGMRGRLFPNPLCGGNSKITVELESRLNGPVYVEIYSTEGRRIYSFRNIVAGENEIVLEIKLPDGLNDGLYYCRVSIGNQIGVWPFIIAN